MATAEQIKSLIRTHFNENRDRFYAIALQVAAHEARQGHNALAHEIRELVDKERRKSKLRVIRPQSRELSGLVLTTQPLERKCDLIVSQSAQVRLERILVEYRQQNKLKKHGLANRRKILLAGPPGTGKTMTAAVLAGELKLQLNTILVDKLVTKFMGETSAKLRQIFEMVSEQQGVYLFDEFDAIGADRSLDNDVGEMRRVLNSFLQFIEQDNSGSLIIAATNNPDLLDHALFRRFDDVLYYTIPSSEEAEQLISNRLGTFMAANFPLKKSAIKSRELSHADITRACEDAIKDSILNNRERVTGKQLCSMIDERKAVYRK